MAGRRSGLGSLSGGTDATANVGCSTNTRDTHGVGSFPCDRAVQRDGELMRGIAHPCACSPRRVVVLGLVQPILHLCRRAGRLHALPLHHVHGLVNALLTPLSVGASVCFLDRFSALGVWRALIESPDIAVFMGVPTMYAKLLAAWENMPHAEQAAASAAAQRRRRLAPSAAPRGRVVHAGPGPRTFLAAAPKAIEGCMDVDECAAT